MQYENLQFIVDLMVIRKLLIEKIFIFYQPLDRERFADVYSSALSFNNASFNKVEDVFLVYGK